MLRLIPFPDNNRHISQTVGLRCCAAIIPGDAAPIDREQAAPPYPLHRLSLGIDISVRSFGQHALDMTTGAGCSLKVKVQGTSRQLGMTP